MTSREMNAMSTAEGSDRVVLLRWRGALAIVGVLGLALAAASCRPSPGGAPDRPAAGAAAATTEAAAETSAVERGEVLIAAGGCSDCHTPLRMGANGPEPDASQRFSGHPESEVVDPAPPPTPHSTFWMWSQSNTVYIGPFGTSFAINLTPDEATGIGAWTDDIFVETIKSGRHWGVARPILPPMPWQSYAQLKDDDLKAIFAYLRTLPPIENRVPEARPAPPPDAAPPAR